MIKQTCSTRKKYTISHQELEPNPSFQRPLQQPLRQQIFYPIFKAPYFSHMSEVNLDNVIDPFNFKMWFMRNFPLQYPYIIWRASNENTQTHKVGVLFLIKHKILVTILVEMCSS